MFKASGSQDFDFKNSIGKSNITTTYRTV